MLVLVCLLFGVSSVFGEGADELIASNNLFTPQVYQQLSKSTNDNFLASPLAADLALGIIFLGARGKTARQVQNVIHIPDSYDLINTNVENGMAQLASDNGYTMDIALNVYIKENFRIKNNFSNTVTSIFRVNPVNIDFTRKADTAKNINSWVEKKTRNKIRDLINPDLLGNRTRLVLANAFYFKGDWAYPFPLAYTSKTKFFKNKADVVEVNAMQSIDNSFYNYFECPHMNAKILEVPFKGEGASMIFVLPNDKDGLAALESKIDMVFKPHNFVRERVNVVLPKFKITREIDFKKILQELGVTDLFSHNEADLSGIGGIQGDLVLDQIIQKSFIEVSEEGVEAAAATFGVVAVPMSAYSDPAKEFIADHPFIFYVKIKDLIAFVGRVTSP